MIKERPVMAPQPAAPAQAELFKHVKADIDSQRCEFLFALPPRVVGDLRGWLEDARDLPAANLVANVALTTLPAAVALFLCGCTSHGVGAAYLVANYALYLQVGRASMRKGRPPGPHLLSKDLH